MLFEGINPIGFFRGYYTEGLESIADIVVGFEEKTLEGPELGRLVLIALSPDSGTNNEALLCRISSINPSGILTSSRGEDYLNTVRRRRESVPQELMQQRVKYLIQARFLGTVKILRNSLTFIPTMRKLPHLTAPVYFAPPEIIKTLVNQKGGTTVLGRYCLGEYVFNGNLPDTGNNETVSLEPDLPVTFDVQTLISRRWAVFARAGYGKSNLIKYLISELYRRDPISPSGLPVGTLIIDADGEYFFPDIVRGRPGLCDVPHLKDKVVVFTDRKPPNKYYASWKVGIVKLDIRSLSPSEVVPLVLYKDKLEQQNVIRLMSLKQSYWCWLVDLVAQNSDRLNDNQFLGTLLSGTPAGEKHPMSSVEINAARKNIKRIVETLHDPESNLLPGVFKALCDGKVVVVDISLLSRRTGELITGLLLRHIFKNNQINFTSGEGPIIPTIAVIEEAQTVLNHKEDDNTSPFVEWVKEGRKYDLGSIMVTQQPSSIPDEILSQTDNWFAFHLLSEQDALTLNRYNVFFARDILTHLIGEPIKGNCYFWSSQSIQFPVSLKVEDFQSMYSSEVNKAKTETRIDTYAANLKSYLGQRFDRWLKDFRETAVRQVKALPDEQVFSIAYNWPSKGGYTAYYEKDLKQALQKVIGEVPHILEPLEYLLLKLVTINAPNLELVETKTGTVYLFPSSLCAYSGIDGIFELIRTQSASNQ